MLSVLRIPRSPALLLALGLALAGCGHDEPQGLLLRSLVAEGRYVVGEAGSEPGLRFPVAPRPAEIEIDQERRPAFLTTPAGWSWRGRVPQGAWLQVGVQAYPAAWRDMTALEAQVVARDGRNREILEVARTSDREHPRWLDFGVDLARYAGREITLEASARLAGLAPASQGSNLVAWAPVAISATSVGRPAAGERPNVLFILVDTLRHDRLTPYGYSRDTTPEIERWLARPGAVVEEAYWQAPWTLPSVVSFMTGRQPGELLGRDMAAFGIPDGVRTLAERLAELGYETGGFYANPTLHGGIGFARGFDTFYVAPPSLESMRLHADDVTGRAVPWLRAHQGQGRPFFLYVHYIDPHDPYVNPDLVDGRSPYFPEYRGRVRGEWVHGFYTGRLELEDPVQDVAQLSALYDSEVHYVDRFIGRLLAALTPEALADTLIVLTSDHGEELHEHGGWKHGQTLYEEQIHVPLLLRWDGRIAPGSRLAGTVRLLDLLPTLMAAAGGTTDGEWDGIDLLPALTGGQALPRRPAFAQHLATGPLRAAAILSGQKLIMFDRQGRFVPTDGLQAHLWRKDVERLERVELYDLESDPGERHNLIADQPEAVARLAPLVHRQLDLELPGLRVATGAAPPGARLGGTIRFERPPAEWISYFLGPEDRVEIDGDRLRFELEAEVFQKGFLVRGDVGSIAAVELALDGVPLAPQRITLGQGKPYRGGQIAPEELLTTAQPAQPGALALWVHDGADAALRRTESDPETARRLRALGYIK